MAIATAIIEFLKELMAAIPYFNKWFTKSVEQKAEDAKAAVKAEDEEFQKTGRPGK